LNAFIDNSVLYGCLLIIRFSLGENSISTSLSAPGVSPWYTKFLIFKISKDRAARVVVLANVSVVLLERFHNNDLAQVCPSMACPWAIGEYNMVQLC
jgi:hypothetical protein